MKRTRGSCGGADDEGGDDDDDDNDDDESAITLGFWGSKTSIMREEEEVEWPVNAYYAVFRPCGSDIAFTILVRVHRAGGGLDCRSNNELSRNWQPNHLPLLV